MNTTQAERLSKTRIGIALFTIALMLMVLLGLGTWQVQRLQWKASILQSIEDRFGNAPIALPDPSSWSVFDPEALDYTPVRFSGTLDPSREVHSYTALGKPNGALSGPGYWILSPVQLENGAHVLVNRGFVPQRMKEATDRPGSASQAPIEGEWTGILRRPDREATFVPDPDIAANQWFRRDPTAMGETLGISDIAPFYIDLDASHTPDTGVPQAGETRIDIPNNHLEYAITWYALALVLLIVSGVWLWQTRKTAAN